MWSGRKWYVVWILQVEWYREGKWDLRGEEGWSRPLGMRQPGDEYEYFRQKQCPLFSLSCDENSGRSRDFVLPFVNLRTTERTRMFVL